MLWLILVLLLIVIVAVVKIWNKIGEIVQYLADYHAWLVLMMQKCGCEQDPNKPPPSVPDWP